MVLRLVITELASLTLSLSQREKGRTPKLIATHVRLLLRCVFFRRHSKDHAFEEAVEFDGRVVG